MTVHAKFSLSLGARLLGLPSGDSAKLIMALAACLLGYGEVGLWLKSEAANPNSWVKLDGNVYLKWIEDYSGPEYQAAVTLGLGACYVFSVRRAASAERGSLTPRTGEQKRSRAWRPMTRPMQRASRSGQRYGRGARSWRRGSGTRHCGSCEERVMGKQMIKVLCKMCRHGAIIGLYSHAVAKGSVEHHESKNDGATITSV